MWKVKVEVTVYGPHTKSRSTVVDYVSKAKTEQAARRNALRSICNRVEDKGHGNYECKIIEIEERN